MKQRRLARLFGGWIKTAVTQVCQSLYVSQLRRLIDINISQESIRQVENHCVWP